MRHFIVYLFLLMLIGCKFELPQALITRTCNSFISIISGADVANPQKYNFTASNTSIINYPITWTTNTGLVLGTSNTNNFSYTFASNGVYDVRASFKNSCGDLISSNIGVITINENCALPTDILLGTNQNGKYNFRMNGPTLDIKSIKWKAVNPFGNLVSEVTNLNINAFEIFCLFDGNYNISAEITTTCGEKINLERVINFVSSIKKDIYCSGSIIENNINTAYYWKNGSKIKLGDGINESNAFSIFVFGNDIYVCGDEIINGVSNATYWKNGIKIILHENKFCTANAIAVSKNGIDVYIVGYENRNGTLIAKYWKNGTSIFLPDLNIQGFTSSIFINNADIYISGYQQSNNQTYSTYWKNGLILKITDGNSEARATSITVDGSNIFVGGSQMKGNLKLPVYWKNGKELILNNLTVGSSNAIAINGSDVFNAGNLIINNKSVVVLWKNEIETKISNPNFDAIAKSIVLYGDDVYLGGTENNKSTIWVNGSGLYLDNRPSNAHSIFIINR